MARVRNQSHRISRFSPVGLVSGLLALDASAATAVNGIVVDLNGQPRTQAQVLLKTPSSHAGPDVITVFTDSNGRFSFADAITGFDDGDPGLRARILGFEQVGAPLVHADANSAEVTLIVRRVQNQAAVAPASAWLAPIENRADKARLVQNCVSCHQAPSAEVRHYAGHRQCRGARYSRRRSGNCAD